MSHNNIYLNSNEHNFDLRFQENIMLCNYARSKNFYFCSMMGGPESIRDLQEAKNLFADAFEFPMIESLFALEKIFLAIEKVFIQDNYALDLKKIFINISSTDGLYLIDKINDLKLPQFLNYENLIFNFDRRSIIKSLGMVKDNNFEIADFEKEINSLIKSKFDSLQANSFQVSISGGITENSLRDMLSINLKPNFIKTGLFTIPIDVLNDNLYQKVFELQKLEVKILSLVNKCLLDKHDYLKIREKHLENYISGKNI